VYGAAARPGALATQYAATLTIALISRGTPEANRAKMSEHGLTYVLLQQDREVATAYQVQGTPTAVIVRADGVQRHAILEPHDN